MHKTKIQFIIGITLIVGAFATSTFAGAIPLLFTASSTSMGSSNVTYTINLTIATPIPDQGSMRIMLPTQVSLRQVTPNTASIVVTTPNALWTPIVVAPQQIEIQFPNQIPGGTTVELNIAGVTNPPHNGMYELHAQTLDQDKRVLDEGNGFIVISGSLMQVRGLIQPPPPYITSPSSVNRFDTCEPLNTITGTGTEGGTVIIQESNITRCIATVVGGSFSCTLSPAYTSGNYTFSAIIIVNGVASYPTLVSGNVHPCSPSPTATITATATPTVNPTYCGSDFIPMTNNWNFISFPLRPTVTSVQLTIATPIAGSFEFIRTFQANDPSGDYWKIYNTHYPPYLSSLNDLRYIDEYSGYWVKVTNPSGVTLPIEGCITDPSLINLALLSSIKNFNMTGYPSNLADAVPTAFASANIDNVQLVRQYNAWDAVDPWKIYNPLLPPYLSSLNDLKKMEKKYGYWIQTKNSASTWTISYGPTNTPIP